MIQLKNLVWCFGLAVLICAVYFQTLSFPFIFPFDVTSLLRDPYFSAPFSLNAVGPFFTSFKESQWIPLSWLSHFVLFAGVGRDPLWHHTANLFLHLFNSFLLLLLLRQLTGKFWLSFYAVAFFALHPLQVEAVTLISARPSLLATTFALVCCRRYLDYIQTAKLHYYLASLLAFLIGMLSSTTLLLFPVVLLAMDSWPLARQKLGTPVKKLIFEKLPFLLISLVFFVVTLIAQMRGGERSELAFGEGIAELFCAALFYLRKVVWPFDLSAVYPTLTAFELAFFGILGVVVLLAVTIYFVTKLNERPYLFFGWAWFLLSFLPASTSFLSVSSPRADQNGYLALAGILFGLTWGVRYLIIEWKNTQVLFRLGAVMLIFMCAALAWEQVKGWRSSEVVFERALRFSPHNDQAHAVLAKIYFERRQFKPAIDHYEQAVRIHETPERLIELGTAYAMTGGRKQAIASYQLALSQDVNLLSGWANLGMVFLREEKYDQGIETLRKALSIEPRNTQIILRLADAYLKGGNKKKGIQLVEEKLKQVEQRESLLAWLERNR